MFRGVFTALVTPFRNGSVDEAALKKHVEEQIAAGVDGVVPCGSTGEAATLSHEEHKRVVEGVVRSVAKRVLVIAGAGSNATAEAIELTAHAKEAGADGALLISPYYNKPTQDGVVAHKYQATAIPQTVIIDREGQVFRVFVGGGPDYADQLRDALTEVTKSGPPKDGVDGEPKSPADAEPQTEQAP